VEGLKVRILSPPAASPLRTDFSRRGKPNGKARSQIVKANDELVKVDYVMRKNGDGPGKAVLI